MSADGDAPRPSDLARLWLAALGGPPRQRPRDQRADLAGIELLRALLDRLALLDPEPDAIEPALAEAAASLDGPDGPARALAAQVRDQWRAFHAAPATAAWLIAEAVERTIDPAPRRRRRDSPTASVGRQPDEDDSPRPRPAHPGRSPASLAVPPGPGDHSPPSEAARRSDDDVA